MARLTLRERRLAYRVAREAWIASGHDPELAESMARQRLVDNTSLPPFVIEIIVSIIVKLIIEWMNSGTKLPPEEPALLHVDDEDDLDGF